MGEKILHSRENGNLTFLPPLAGILFLPAFGGGFAPLALESGDSRFRGNGDMGGNGGDDKNGGLGGCPLSRGIRAVGAGVGRFPLSREWGGVFCVIFLFPSLLPPLLPHSPPPLPFPRKRESPVKWGGAGNACTAPLLEEDFQLIHRYQLQ